ncbi:acyltransferase [Streptomyces eurocidicus]|uniref:Acyltransferase n=1 Tax=Streptomyces eurocidicus TaxID=66423 RepID=A0A2N8NRT7_STREU|nr:GNAT family N-acetyltransferase [Streptomyces eurocidicus]MBB5117065.1 GNAT superfamily N-acetyltransferase [Streptomyces eurocidicus]MBF6052638.1 GNAT family N-acetyltransferase [Streptomyces eurocidicus]PNE31485.1 acyltransferase [Streptomyces eurocidicus]
MTTESPFRVRPRSAADLGGCAAALAQVHARDAYPLDWPADPAAWLTPSSLLAAWVAERDGEVAGHVALCRAGAGDTAPAVWGARRGPGADAAVVVGRLFVAPAARGHGAGALLLAAATHEARRRALHPVLDVVASDTAATALYERAGWTRLTTAEQRWGPDRTVTVHCYAAGA